MSDYETPKPKGAYATHMQGKARSLSNFGQNKMLGGFALGGAGIAGVMANPILGVAGITAGATMAQSGAEDMMKARHMNAKATALDNLAKRGMGTDLGSKMRALPALPDPPSKGKGGRGAKPAGKDDAGRSSYQTSDGRAVDGTKAQQAAWKSRRKNA